MKKLLIVVILLALMVATVIPVLAAPEELKGGQNRYVVAGIVTAVDTGAKTLTIHVVLANKKAKSYIGQDLTIQTLDTTYFVEKTGHGKVKITLADLSPNDTVRVKGRVIDSVFYATNVKAGVHLP